MIQQLRIPLKLRATSQRRGAIVVVVVFAAIAVCCLAALAINVAYIELTKTEMRMATDAAAKASITTLGHTQNLDLATQSAITVALRHQVANLPLSITRENLEYGRSVKVGSRYEFQPLKPDVPTETINAVRITATLGSTGRQVLAFPKLLSADRFNLSMQVSAAKIDHDICLIVDRSSSMAWDLSNQNFSYPAELNTLPKLQNFITPPHATLSRWAALKSSIDLFLDLLRRNPFEPKVSLVSYASTYKFGDHSVTVSNLDQPLTLAYAAISNSLDHYKTVPLMGATNITAGLSTGINHLNDPRFRRMTSQKSIILFSDGLFTDGPDPTSMIAAANDSNITIYTISFSDQANKSLMANIARQTHGQHFHANTAEELRQAFRRIAETLPTVLIQ
jgi:Ca-activated chloride channel homolog